MKDNKKTKGGKIAFENQNIWFGLKSLKSHYQLVNNLVQSNEINNVYKPSQCADSTQLISTLVQNMNNLQTKPEVIKVDAIDLERNHPKKMDGIIVKKDDSEIDKIKIISSMFFPQQKMDLTTLHPDYAYLTIEKKGIFSAKQKIVTLPVYKKYTSTTSFIKDTELDYDLSGSLQYALMFNHDLRQFTDDCLDFLNVLHASGWYHLDINPDIIYYSDVLDDDSKKILYRDYFVGGYTYLTNCQLNNFYGKNFWFMNKWFLIENWKSSGWNKKSIAGYLDAYRDLQIWLKDAIDRWRPQLQTVMNMDEFDKFVTNHPDADDDVSNQTIQIGKYRYRDRNYQQLAPFVDLNSLGMILARVMYKCYNLYAQDNSAERKYYGNFFNKHYVILPIIYAMMIENPNITSNSIQELKSRMVNTSQSGGLKIAYKGRKYMVRTGTKGGRYISVKGKRVYI